jgi:hypothetical protein
MLPPPGRQARGRKRRHDAAAKTPIFDPNLLYNSCSAVHGAVMHLTATRPPPSGCWATAHMRIYSATQARGTSGSVAVRACGVRSLQTRLAA